MRDGLTNIPGVTYPDNEDRALRRAWNGGKHDEEVNTVRWSTIADKINVAKDEFNVHGDWEPVQTNLNKLFKIFELAP